MKKHREIIKTALKAVVMKQGQKEAVECLAKHLKGVELEAGFRSNTVKQLDEMLKHADKKGGELPIDEHTRTIQLLLGNQVKAPKLTKHQIECLTLPVD
jgi:hypothetical protein